MRKRGLSDNAVAVKVTPSSGTHHAMTLLGAAPFLLRDNHNFIWPDAALCKTLLKINNGTIPETSKDWAARISHEDNRKRNKAIRSLSWDGAQYSVTYKLRLDDARDIWVQERGERLSGVDNVASEVSGIFINVDSSHRAQERAAFMSSHDELTGLWNAARMQEGVNHIIAFVRRYDAKALYLRLRVSNLADINATYGYETGDRVLKLIAARLEEFTEAPDIVARTSGRAFGLGLYSAKADEAEVIAKSLRESLSDVSYPTPHGPLFAEFDMAYTTLGDQAFSALEALAQTGAALENSEANSENLVSFTEDMAIAHIPHSQNETTADDILAALNDRRISLAFQPIIDTKTRDLHHYECLLRLRTDEGAVISAGSFIMAAERLSLVHMLDRRALELAGEALRQYPDIHIALNVSAATVKDLGTADAYITALKALGPDVKRVTLELTETVALEDPAMASRFSVETRALGCEFAIDDFGSGYTTFQNLMAIEADTIKIDGTFIEGIANTPHKETFVRMMVDLAQTFGVKTVAEMVDSRADADLLKRLGVDYLQGYMFGVPSAVPAWRQVS